MATDIVAVILCALVAHFRNDMLLAVAISGYLLASGLLSFGTFGTFYYAAQFFAAFLALTMLIIRWRRVYRVAGLALGCVLLSSGAGLVIGAPVDSYFVACLTVVNYLFIISLAQSLARKPWGRLNVR